MVYTVGWFWEVLCNFEREICGRKSLLSETVNVARCRDNNEIKLFRVAQEKAKQTRKKQKSYAPS